MSDSLPGENVPGPTNPPVPPTGGTPQPPPPPVPPGVPQPNLPPVTGGYVTPPVPGGTYSAGAPTPAYQAKPDNYLVWSILSLLLCCWVTGIFAVIASSQVDSLWAQGRTGEAYAASEKAKKWSIAGAVVGVVVVVLYLLFILVMALAGSSAPHSTRY